MVVSTDLDELALTPVLTERMAVRQEIASMTMAKRNQFFIEKKDFFLPLLPPSNYITKLADKHEALSPEEKGKVPSSIPYEQLEAQPRGITATMKPYQLTGLSFMVYLHRNGLSGILGDEMGLGKTLQTLSLIQYLKENEPKTGTQLRPFLVVCPLSVLSSWMAEARKWAPGLKVLRFHGPMKERDRLKKVAAGEIDLHGNMTTKQKMKLNARNTAAGKQPIVSLDSDDEDSKGVDLVVTTYECYLSEQGWFKRAFVWRYVILDEGHKIK
jgi:SWI/SNF-related matrix-associated actin-dependent regulator of chromatin subfamily A member 5